MDSAVAMANKRPLRLHDDDDDDPTTENYDDMQLGQEAMSAGTAFHEMASSELLQHVVGQSTLGQLEFCQVCGDRGTGFHYNAYTCDACKGFFKRTVQRGIIYNCKEINECIINKYTRNVCQSCRFQKSLKVGMNREGIKEDPYYSRSKKMKTEESLVQVEFEYDSKDLTLYLEARADLVPEKHVPEFEHKETCKDNKLGVNELMNYGYMELRFIIEWARKVPGFSELLIDDQMQLLKASFMELNVFRLAFRSMSSPGGIRFCNEITYLEDMATMSSGVKTSPLPSMIGDNDWVKELFNCHLAFVKRLKEIDIDLTEFSILNAIILTYPDAVGIQNKMAVTNLQCKHLATLHKYTSDTYPNDKKRHARQLLRLPTLRLVSAKASECFLSMSLDGSIKMNALVIEMMN